MTAACCAAAACWAACAASAVRGGGAPIIAMGMAPAGIILEGDESRRLELVRSALHGQGIIVNFY